MTTKQLTFLLTLTALIGCCDTTTYKSAKVVVIDTKHRHWGKGYYELEIYYQYFNDTDTVTGHSTTDGKERSYTAKYIPGDSLKMDLTRTTAQTLLSARKSMLNQDNKKKIKTKLILY